MSQEKNSEPFEKTQRQCGYIAILGQPNAGKSTLLNSLVGQKIAGVSNKPQTTRNKILGIVNNERSQLLLLDTPGIHRNNKGLKLNRLMNREAWSVIQDADIILYLIDGAKGWLSSDADFFTSVLSSAKSSKIPVLPLLSKVDQIKKPVMLQMQSGASEQLEELYESVDEQTKACFVAKTPLPISAKRRETHQALWEKIEEYLPQSDWLFPEDDLTDRPQAFIVSEIIREKVFRCLGDELPYQAAVAPAEIRFDQGLVHVEAEIIVARQTHKGMVVGKKGAKIKEIGMAARKDLEKHFESRVFIGLQVRVDRSWIDNEALIAQYAGIDKDG